MSEMTSESALGFKGHLLTVPMLALGLLVASMGTALAQSADPSGPHAPSPTPAETPALAETPDVAGLLAALDEPGATTPPFSLTPPTAIVGQWYSGTVSDINFTDPSGGWQNAGGEGEQYTFDPDGTWQYGWLLQSSSGFCSTNVLVLRSGILASDEADHILLLHAQQATITSRDSCAEDENYERDVDLTDDGLMWQRSSDEYGEVLRLRGPKTDYSDYRLTTE